MKAGTFAGLWSSVFGLSLAISFLAGCKTEEKTAQFAPLPGTQPAPQPAAVGSSRVTVGPGAKVANSQTAAPRVRDLISVGDILQITFTDFPVAVQPSVSITGPVSDDGTIRLILNQKFTAAGKKLRQLEEEIQERYVPKFFKTMTASVSWGESTLFFYVDGEVKRPDRQVYIGRMTVLKAITSANGFTDFAHTTNVSLTRADGLQYFVNCINARKDPQLDLEVFPGDRIYVERKPTPFSR